MTPWYFNLGVDFSSLRVINGVRFYACQDGVLIIYPCHTRRFIKNSFYDDVEL